jgi:dGTPase
MLASRDTVEMRERSILAPYAARSTESRGRRHDEAEHPYRTCYQRDRDRVIHSTAFRRLQYKTQVFVTHEGDYCRTRLTHTLEVAQIARTIARALNLNEDLVEAIALAHDLGHTPFGHSGEDALRELMRDHGGFEHNQHGLRVVDVLEQRYARFPGLNLTWEVREALGKHRARLQLPLPDEFDDGLQPTLEAQVVEVADSVAYDSHDLDDALKAGLIGEKDLSGVRLWDMARDRAEREFGPLEAETRRTHLVRFLINLEVTALLKETGTRLEERGVDSAERVREMEAHLVGFDDETDALRGELQDFLSEHVYRHYRVMRMATKARRFVEKIFAAYIRNPEQLPRSAVSGREGDDIHRTVCDYIAGMTDRYAQDEYLKLFAPFERV